MAEPKVEGKKNEVMYVGVDAGLAASEGRLGAQMDLGFGAIVLEDVRVGAKVSVTDRYIGPQIEYQHDLFWRLNLKMSAGAAWQQPSKTYDPHGEYSAARSALSRGPENAAAKNSGEPNVVFSESVGVGIRLYEQLELSPKYNVFFDGHDITQYGTLTFGGVIPF